MRHGIFVKRHAKVFDRFKLLIMKDFSRSSSNSVLLAIEMRKLHSDSSEGFKERNLLDVNKVSSSSFIDRVLFNLDPDVNISSNDARLNSKLSTYSLCSPVKI